MMSRDELSRDVKVRASSHDPRYASRYDPSPRYSGLRHHAKVHSFRFLTVILAWLLMAAAFYQKPELLTGLQRAIQHGMETVGDAIPSPWGPRIEFVFREIGGFIWLQITLIVLVLRIVLSSIAGLWGLMRRRDARQ